MDQDLKKALKDMTEAITSLAESRPREAAAVPVPAHSGLTWKQLWLAIPTLLVILGAAWWILQYTISSEITKAFLQPNLTLQKLQDDVAQLRTDVNTLQHQALQVSLSAASKKSEDAKAQLSNASSILSQMEKQKVSYPASELTSTSAQLQKVADVNKNLPETWVVVGQYLTYRSQVLSGWEETNLPLCTSQPSKMTLLQNVEPGTNVQVHVGPITYRSCKIILDSPEATAKLSENLSLNSVAFEHCVIFYNGGPLVLYPVKVARDSPAELRGTIHFSDCVFRFSLQAIPPPAGQRLATELLEANSNSFDFTVSPS